MCAAAGACECVAVIMGATVVTGIAMGATLSVGGMYPYGVHEACVANGSCHVCTSVNGVPGTESAVLVGVVRAPQMAQSVPKPQCPVPGKRSSELSHAAAIRPGYESRHAIPPPSP